MWSHTSTHSICISGVERENFTFIPKNSGKLIEIVNFIDIIPSSKVYSHVIGQEIRHFSPNYVIVPLRFRHDPQKFIIHPHSL